MTKVLFPLRLRMTGDAVADLHTALVELGNSISSAEVSAQRFGASTRDAVRDFQTTNSLPPSGEVDEATARKLNELLREPSDTEPRVFRISGSVLRTDDTPVADAEIRFARQGITKTTPLGRQSSTKTDASGRFAFEYPRPTEPIDLSIELVAPAGRAPVPTQRRVIGNAGPDEQLTFVIGDGPFRGPSTFDDFEQTLRSTLATEQLEPAQLVTFDRETLARLSLTTGIEPGPLILLRQSFALAEATKLPPVVFFALGQEKIPIASLPTLLSQDPQKRRAALDAALANNHISSRLEREARAALDQLDQLAIAKALEKSTTAEVTSVGTLLEAARLSATKSKKLVDRYVAHSGTPKEFWQAVTTSGDLTEAEVARVQFELQLAVATQNHAPLNSALKAAGVAKLADLGKFDQQGWLGLIRGAPNRPGTGLPADLKAAGVTEEDYARLIFATVEDALPTAMLANRIASFPESKRIKAFLDSNPGFDLRSTPVHTFLAQNPGALSFARNEAEAAAVTSAMKGVERAYRIAPPGARLETMAALLAEGVDSARKVRSLGRATFLRRFRGKLPDGVAERVYRRANNASALSEILLARHGVAFNATPFQVLPNAKLPTLFDFFGSQDFCSCCECQSVFSPAAYLVDLLHWLEGRPANVAPSGTALDILFDGPQPTGGRRADIGGIELSCENTNTPLPYIDIVNETLELLVAPPQAPVRYQTTGSVRDLRAHPQHALRAAYAVLAGDQVNAAQNAKDAVYPFNLPFNLWLEEARTYLGQLGLPRHRVMEALQGATAARADVGVAIETLGMSPVEWDVIADRTNPVRTVSALWGLTNDPNFVGTLATVSTLLARATPPIADHGMEFSELTELLRTDFVQKAAPLKILFTGASCNTNQATLDGLTADHLRRIHRFLRLQRRLNWSMPDLDRAIQVLGAGTLNGACLKRISHARRLVAALGVPLCELLSWWGLIDTRRWRRRLIESSTTGGFQLAFDNHLSPRPERDDEASPYDRLFQSPSLGPDSSNAFEIDSDGDELKTAGVLSLSLTPVASALNTTVEDLAELLPRLAQVTVNGQPNPAPSALNLANLSALYAHLSLGRALGCNMRDLVGILALTGIDPFQATNTAAALEFIDEARFIKSSGFSVQELNYLLRHVDTKPATLQPDPTGVAVFLFELGAALRSAQAQRTRTTEALSVAEVRALLVGLLRTLLDAQAVGEALAIIDIDPQQNQSPPNTAAQFIADHFEGLLDIADATTKLAIESDPLYVKEQRKRLEYAFDSLSTQVAKFATVIDRLAAALGIDPAVVAPLLREHLRDPSGSGRSLLELFGDDAVRDFGDGVVAPGGPALPSPADLPEHFVAYELLYKTALILTRLGISKNELSWVLVQGPARGTLDFQTLPVTTSSTPAPYRQWRRLTEAVTLRNQLSPRELFDLFETAASPQAGPSTYEALLQELGRRTRWAPADIEFLVGAPARSGVVAQIAALGFQYPADWRDERPLARLAEVMDVVRRIGLSARTIWEWRSIKTIPAQVSPTALTSVTEDHERQAKEIKQAVRARHEEAQWYEVAPVLRDRLRERQRDALVGWLVGNDGRFADANALFEHLLLDVEMSACALTSRIKQAISSTQLFVQRLLLGLEVDGTGRPLVELSKAESDEWTWRQSHRVWEANRKIFLYPENWLEPELRDDKTPFFVELENELLQNEVTAESAETAVRHYLEKLDRVARLEIVGLCEQKDEGAERLHVFGRTRGIPPTYYHRQRTDGVWSPWEVVEAGIEGNHLIPVVFNRRLCLFWTVITEAAVEERTDIPAIDHLPGQADLPLRYYQIRLAWSELTSSGWSAKKVATEYIGQDVTSAQALKEDLSKNGASTPAEFCFRAVLDDPSAAGDLIIEPIRVRPVPVFFGLQAKSLDDPHEPLPKAPTNELPTHGGNPFGSGPWFLPRFRISGCDGSARLVARPSGTPTVRGPQATVPRYQTFARVTGSGRLSLPAPNVVTVGTTYTAVLEAPQVPFEIVPAHMDDLGSGQPFFYQDSQRTFLIEQRPFFVWVRDRAPWSDPTNNVPDALRLLADVQERPRLPDLDPWIYDAQGIVRSPPSITLRDPVPSAPADRSLAALAGTSLVASLASRVAFISQTPQEPRSSRFVLGRTARVVDETGAEIGKLSASSSNGSTSALPQVVVTGTYVMPSLVAPQELVSPLLKTWVATTYQFDTFYHPYVCSMRRELNRFGPDGLFDPPENSGDPELATQQKNDLFFDTYGPLASVRQPRPRDSFDFSLGGPYSIYNWEIFFHVPLRVACRLSQNQRFADARKWFHYIFDPTETEGTAPRRFWKVKPLFELFNDETADSGPIAELLLLLQYDGADPEKIRRRDELTQQVAAWRADAFNPHAIARLRLTVYARTVVMKYIDNLIEWGDQLFRRDTLESINEATQLYVLAAQLLGRRPRKVDREPPTPTTFAAMRSAGIDPFSNALLEEIEGLLPEIIEAEADVYENEIALTGSTLLFCLPPNEKLLTDYWGRVADRLFKIRHCMNIEGSVRQLPLFEPPIDPALLVRARGLGVDLASALSDLNAPLPCYRYQVLSQKATELCSDVRGLGQALLSALEKKDAEELALVRAGHQVKLEDALIDVRKRQIAEAKESLAALQKSKENAEIRRDYYRSRDFMNAAESVQIGSFIAAGLFDAGAQGLQALAAILGAAPNVDAGTAGFGGTPYVTFSSGGSHLTAVTTAASAALRIYGAIADRLGQLSGLVGSYRRRADDWVHQAETAEIDIEALERQLAAAEIRVAIAEKELTNLETQLAQSKEAEALLHDKYTNLQLYQWMVGQLSALHFQAYQLAYDLAKRAERAWQFELGIDDQSFIQFGYWDSLKKGLLAGDRLHHDLKRMDVAYLESHKREYELVRHISLRELDPIALLRLKREGIAIVNVDEHWFDRMTPGHYLRRIKTAALSLPSVTGPYVSIPCTLTLERSSIRTSAEPSDTPRPDVGGTQAIVTSRAQEDSGLFETNLRDDRYLPFEGRGAISQWKLELPMKFRQFDYETISDAILHLRYTARDGGHPLRAKAEERVKNALETPPPGSPLHVLSARSDFPGEWASFLAPPDNQTDQTLALPIEKHLFPHPLQASTIKVVGFDLFLVIENIEGYRSGNAVPVKLEVSPPGASTDVINLISDANQFGGLPHGAKSFGNATRDLGTWAVKFKEAGNTGVAASVASVGGGHRRLNPEDVRDLVIVLQYKVS